MYKIEFSNTAYKFMISPRLPAADSAAIKKRILALSADPRPAGCEKLKGFKLDYFRVRQGNYRIVYEVLDREIRVVIVYIGHRREIYRSL